MYSLTTLITAASLLLHTLLGCCTHGDHGSCACQRGSLGAARHEHDHDGDAGHHHAGHDHAGDRTGKAERDEHSPPPHPCRCHCDGNRCQAIAGACVRGIDAPDLSFDVLPPLHVRASAGGSILEPSRLVDPVAATPALPVRAHLLYESLLI